MESDLSDLVKSFGLNEADKGQPEDQKGKSVLPKGKAQASSAEEVQRNIARLERRVTTLFEKIDEREKAEKEDPDQYTFIP